MKRVVMFALFFTAVLCYCPPFEGMPRFMERFDADRNSKAELRGRCTVCHTNAEGFGPKTPFGKAFADNGYQISADLRAKFPNLFPTGESAKVPAAPPFQAAAFFAASCAICHGKDGRGAANAPPTIPDFSDGGWQSRHPNDSLIRSITNGKGAIMPPWKDKLTEDQIKEMVAVVRKFAEK
jgi:mono/diheme cytochrome c family protein